jgi:hypothetical protein
MADFVRGGKLRKFVRSSIRWDHWTDELGLFPPERKILVTCSDHFWYPKHKHSVCESQISRCRQNHAKTGHACEVPPISTWHSKREDTYVKF